MVASFWSPRAFQALVACVGLFPVVQACGSRSDTEDYLFESDGTINRGGASSGAGRGGSNATAGRRPGGGSPGVAGGGVGGRGPTGGVGATGGADPIGGDPGFGGAGSGGTGVAGDAGAPSSHITCGAQTCDGSRQSCCLGNGFQCIDKGDACSGPVLGCTTHQDCAGELCCLSLTGDVADASSCKPSCDSGGMGRDRQLCDTDADCQPPFRFCRATVFGLNLCVFRR